VRTRASHSRGTTSLGQQCRPPQPPTASANGRGQWPPLIGCPGNGGLPESPTRGSILVQGSAQERTSAGLLRAGLSVLGPASLAAFPRLLLSVFAFDEAIFDCGRYYASEVRSCQMWESDGVRFALGAHRWTRPAGKVPALRCGADLPVMMQRRLPAAGRWWRHMRLRRRSAMLCPRTGTPQSDAGARSRALLYMPSALFLASPSTFHSKKEVPPVSLKVR